MAAIDSFHSSHQPSITMANRRVPLAQVPNAVNSPLRHNTLSTTAPKRSRSQAVDAKESFFGQQPPAKKQIIEVTDPEARRGALPRRTNASQPTELQLKFEAVRDAKASARNKPTQQPVDSNLEHIRTWQRHYKRAFPQYTFYFDNVPDDVKPKISKQLRVLGAREEKFFSKSITHVVTTRPIPPEYKSSSSANGRPPSSHGKDQSMANGQPQTINPSLLERTQGEKSQKGKFNFDAPMTRAAHATAQSLFQDVETRKQYGHSADILHKAREMGMKIWALEKLQRMMTTMFETDTGEQPNLPVLDRAGKDANLQQLLQKEKITGPANVSLASQEMVTFSGYYIYVHDQDEKTKPIMIRDYQKPDDGPGNWPQLHASSAGRCPFIEDPDRHARKYARERQASPRRKPVSFAPTAAKTRSAIPRARDDRSRSRLADPERRPLAENNSTNVVRYDSTLAGHTEKSPAKPSDPSMAPPKKGTVDGIAPLFGSAQLKMRMPPRVVGGEPVASGIQPSHITSAIRSQMISSTAAGTGVRAGTSREVHQLQRKVLERNSVASGSGSVPSSYLNDVRAAINTGLRDAPPRAAKLKAQETLGYIHEDMTPSEERTRKLKKTVIRKRKAEKEAKPGYCENCREKFADFDQHCLSRKHRKFASTIENWTELDDLLSQLERPVRGEMMVCD
ncbi:hypothetical protein P152DRAFT_481509 [Eremomyces bilateralis CBS 781.70]|uniref:DBF4-type domain-containing protein n=1 Tax=Eremomyces bilateralis CBS 781.70 TaxID=1392243 RepID=A0A6G1G6B4_9PEZI|nr:uncharacterized protein P152DRAFT_481509 [Eremomyces bilateralis CBS 781.70]KAF1813420.1 hypothetical protein P152DRAFT_481509 [Eremomyces bilateralis CBS 781.70]